MVVIDTNSLIILVLGLIDPRLIDSHKRTSIYSQKDFENLLAFLPDFKNLLVLPNIWTEVDNLLNRQIDSRKYQYIESLKFLTENTTEKYITSRNVVLEHSLFDLGLTDAAILLLAQECSFLVTSDSRLSDYAKAMNIPVYDLVEERNKRLLGGKR